MTIVNDAVDKMEKKLAGSGCDHGSVTLAICPEGRICPYLEGSCLEAEYGGKGVQIATSYPIEAKTRVSFMYGEELGLPAQRTAACAILNCLSSFMCFSRVSGSCPENSYERCLCELKDEIGEKKIYLNGRMPLLENNLQERIVSDPDDADLIIVSGDGIFSNEGIQICDRYSGKKEMLYIGPGTSGIANILDNNHWCPYGRK